MQNPHLLRRMTSTIKTPVLSAALQVAASRSRKPRKLWSDMAPGSRDRIEVRYFFEIQGTCVWLLSLPHLKRKESIADHRHRILFSWWRCNVWNQTKSLRVKMSKPYNTRDDSPATSVFTPVACYEMNGGHVLPSIQKTPELTTSTQDLPMESTTQLWHFGTWASWAEACI